MDRTKIALSGAAGALLAALINFFVLREGLHGDFVVIWSAHQVENPYDIAGLRQAIGDIAELPKGDWPYAYPPMFLLLTTWFKLIPYGVTYVLWGSLTGGALVASARHPASPLLLLSPWVIYALMGGQTAMAVGALVMFGLVAPPLAGGVLLGVAACIKPQFLLLVGIGLLFAGQWGKIVTAGATVLLLAILATLAYGSGVWADWFRMLPTMAAYSETIAPHLNAPGWALKAVALAGGLAMIWSFRDSGAEERMITATGTSLLVLPHSLWYNAAIMAPAVVALFARVGWRMAPSLASMLLFPTSYLVALTTAYPWLLARMRQLKLKRSAA